MLLLHLLLSQTLAPPADSPPPGLLLYIVPASYGKGSAGMRGLKAQARCSGDMPVPDTLSSTVTARSMQHRARHIGQSMGTCARKAAVPGVSRTVQSTGRGQS